jgi:hypothetical protein
MTAQGQKPGERYDRLTQNARRLNITHLSLALLMSIVYYTRPSSFHPMPVFARGLGLAVVVSTVIAWLPYFVSWCVSRALLVGTERGVLIFIPLAIAISLVAAAFCLDLFSIRGPMLVLSVCLALLLVAAAGLCVAIGGRSLDD